MDIKAEDLYKDINSNGAHYCLGWMASILEHAIKNKKRSVPVKELLQAFDKAKEYSKQVGDNDEC